MAFSSYDGKIAAFPWHCVQDLHSLHNGVILVNATNSVDDPIVSSDLCSRTSIKQADVQHRQQ